MTTYTFKHPLMVGDKPLRSTEVRRPRIKDLRQLDPLSDGIEKDVKCIELLCDFAEHHLAAIDEIDTDDHDGLMDVIVGFFSTSPTGDTKSGK